MNANVTLVPPSTLWSSQVPDRRGLAGSLSAVCLNLRVFNTWKMA
jgi:hypothetical protein